MSRQVWHGSFAGGWRSARRVWYALGLGCTGWLWVVGDPRIEIRGLSIVRTGFRVGHAGKGLGFFELHRNVEYVYPLDIVGQVG